MSLVFFLGFINWDLGFKSVFQSTLYLHDNTSATLNNVQLVISYLRYVASARFNRSNPAGFLSQLTKEVISDNRTFYAFGEIENLKQELINNEEVIRVKDFGAGSRNKSTNIRRIGDIIKSTCIPPKYGKLLFRLVNYFQPNNILELGTGIGISSLYLSMPIKHKTMVTIEGSEKIAKVAQSNFDKLKLKNVRLLAGTFDHQLPEALQTLKSVDFIFIDGDHRKERLIWYFNICLASINENSIIVIDDINWSKDMHDGWKQVSKHPVATLSVDLFRLGIIFFKKDLPRQQVTLMY